jgi:hypothetical protein
VRSFNLDGGDFEIAARAGKLPRCEEGLAAIPGSVTGMAAG